MFINRKKELNFLEVAKGSLLKGERINITVFGLRRIGKTELLLNFKERIKENNLVVVYLNLQKIIGGVPEFSKVFYRSLIYELALNKGIKTEELLNIEDALILATKLGDLEVENTKKMLDILKQKELDIQSLLELTFNLPEKLALKNQIKIIYILDEFQEITKVHRDILKLMRAITEKQKKVAYFVAGSIVSLLKDIFSSQKPFYGQFEQLKLNPFDKVSSYQLIESLFFKFKIKTIDYEKKLIFNLTQGHPYYLTKLCHSIIRRYFLIGEVNKKVIEYCFVQETLDKDGSIYEHFDYILEISLAQFKNKNIYKKILFLLAENKLNLTDISKGLDKPVGETDKYLKSLVKTDIILKRDNLFCFSDNLFRFWISKVYLGKNPKLKLTEKIIQQIISDLEEKYLQASTELGKSKEYEYKVKLEKEFKLKLENYNRNNIEFDLIGKKNNIYYIFEIKNKNKPTDYKDVKNFLEKIKKSEFENKNKKLSFISKSGFTKEAEKLMEKNKINFFTENNL